jgi:hypothetical protein
MIQIENQRWEKIKDLIPDFKKTGFPWKVLEYELENIPLKHIVSSLYYYSH